ncbi:hypothetical protein N8D56_27575 (plasmid) [Devosia sp. A8/3-2]|nr:hypothetical protein N8D56_27575 [Devosia sp. A8/3-2]
MRRWFALPVLLLVLPVSAIAAPTCEVSEQGMTRVLKALCGSPNGAAPAADCVAIEDTRTHIFEAVVFIEGLTQCGKRQRQLAQSAFAGLAEIRESLAALARCAGVEIDVSSLIAEARAEVQSNSQICPTGEALQHATNVAMAFSRAQDVLPSLYKEAGVIIDAEGNVREE